MNSVKRTARKRHLRQKVNQLKLEGKEILPTLRNAQSWEWSKDQIFMLEVAAKQKPYYTTTPFRAMIRAMYGFPIFGEKQ